MIGLHPLLKRASISPQPCWELETVIRSPSAEAADLIRRLGLERQHAEGLVSAGRIEFDGRLWRPSRDGELALLVPVRIGSWAGLDTDEPRPGIETLDAHLAVRHGALGDVLAFRPDNPHRFALRLGYAEVLGAVDRQTGRAQLQRDVLKWVRAYGAGIVVLDLERGAEALAQVREVVVEDVQHGMELHALFERRCLISAPRIKVPLNS